jgi:hypothetical protein
MKLRPSEKVGLMAMGAIVVVWAARSAYSTLSLVGYEPARAEPGRVNVIALPREAGYRVIVSNGIAHLVQAGDDEKLEAPENDRQAERDAPRLPVRELLQSLQGDADALGKLTMAVNNMSDEAVPPNPVVWPVDDIERAINGDQALRRKLERDLLMTLDGRPLEEFTVASIQSGIVLEIPVPVRVPVGEKFRVVTAKVREPFRTEFATRVETRIAEKFNPPKETLAGIYRDEATQIARRASETGQWPDVVGMLRSRYSPSRVAGLTKIPERLLEMVDVIVSDDHLTGATFRSYDGPNRRKLSDVTLTVTDEGRMRLWKYSNRHPGFQLLLTVDGVAIAAPRIKTELMGREVTLTRIPSEVLVSDAVDLINQTVSQRKSS